MNTTILIKTSSGITQVSLEAQLLAERYICVNGEITSEMAIDFTDKILSLNIDSKEEPITILINSPGGEINSGLLMIDCFVV